MTPHPLASSHEFPVVALAVSALTWLRTVIGGVPGLAHLRRRRARRATAGACDLGVVGTCQATAIWALAASAGAPARDQPELLADPRIVARARRVSRCARWRWRGDPLALDHAHTRAALALADQLDGSGRASLRADAARRAAGVPASEPGWVRPLDGSLAAIALHRLGAHDDVARWVHTLHASLGLRRSHRPAWLWTPVGLTAGRAPLWEHATTSALCRAMGWVGDDDWTALRQRLLAAAARGGRRPLDERAIAAGRVWLAFVDDEQATRILRRPSVGADALAVAIDALATALVTTPDGLVRFSLRSSG